ncbi:hypothetical protein [Halobacillus sp. B23F22_1]
MHIRRKVHLLISAKVILAAVFNIVSVLALMIFDDRMISHMEVHENDSHY